MRVTVFGLGHQGAVTAACLAAAGHEVVGLDDDGARVAALAGARPPEQEPGLGQRLRDALAAGRLRFTPTPDEGAARCEVLWLAFDAPLAEDDAPQADLVRARFDALAPRLTPGTLIVVSTQAPVGFVRALEERWTGAGLRFCCLPENLRVGDGVRSFEQAARVVAGVRTAADRERVERLLAPLGRRVEWMSPESAEMTKHGLNAWLATSVAFANELARLCEPAGADADEVARGLRSDPRVGPRAYLSPGAPFSGGTLARDLRSLSALAARQGVEAPLASAVLASNAAHQRWTLGAVRDALRGVPAPVAAVLGLAYKPGTDVVRRSAALELALALAAEGTTVRAHDPAVRALPAAAAAHVLLCAEAGEALAGADVAVVATAWPDYAALTAVDLKRWMRRPHVVDPAGVLEALAGDPHVRYRRPGRSPRRP